MSDAAFPSSDQLRRSRPYLDQIIQGVLLFYIASLPFTSIHFRLFERIGFLVLLTSLGVWSVWHRRHFILRTPIDVPVGIFLLWVGLTIPFSTMPVYSFQEYGKLIKVVLIFYATLYFFREQKRWVELVWMLVGVELIICIYGLAHYEHPNYMSMTSFLPSEVWLVTYLVMMLPLSMALMIYVDNPWAKGVCVVSILLASCCLLLTQSRAGILSFVVELLGMAVLVQRRALITIAVAVTIFYLLTLSFVVAGATLENGSWYLKAKSTIPLKLSLESMAHRLDIWAFLLEQVAEHPIVGIGYGKNTVEKLSELSLTRDPLLAHSRNPVTNQGAHNIFLELALHVGIPGLLFFVWGAVRLIKTVMANFRLASDGFARSVLLGLSVGIVGVLVRCSFDQMLVGVLAVQFGVLAAIGMLAGGSYWPCPDRGAVQDVFSVRRPN